VWQRTKGYQPEIWVARGEDQQILAIVLPVTISIRGGILRLLTTHTIVYGSILCDPCDDAKEALRVLLLRFQNTHRVRSIYTELRNIYDMSDYQPVLEQSGFSYEEHLNYKIDLTGSPDAVFSRIGKRTQKHIKRASTRDVLTIEEVTDRSGIQDCYQLLCKTYQLARVPLADVSLFEAAFDVLYPKGMLRVTLARHGTIPAAVSFELLYKDVMYGWYGGMDRLFSRYTPNELLMWQILRWGAENGYREYDFGGAGKPDEDYGVRDFKAKFGGELVNYGRFKWVANPFLFFLSSMGYQLYRRLYNYLPRKEPER
jgi:predicted N-acyltransferase